MIPLHQQTARGRQGLKTGAVRAVGELTPDQGWDVMREVSQHTNINLRHVSEPLIEWALTGNLCVDIRAELDCQLTQQPHPPPIAIRQLNPARAGAATRAGTLSLRGAHPAAGARHCRRCSSIEDSTAAARSAVARIEGGLLAGERRPAVFSCRLLKGLRSRGGAPDRLG